MKVNFVPRLPTVAEGRKGKTIYLERPPNERYFTIYVTFEDPEFYASTLPQDAIGEMVAQFASGLRSTFYVNNIEERDALKSEGKLTTDALVMVKDASGDNQLQGEAGIAYFYSEKTQAFVPSFRMAKDPYANPPWEELHTHTNKDVLDSLDVEKDDSGEPVLVDGKKILTFEGRRVAGVFIDTPSW